MTKAHYLCLPNHINSFLYIYSYIYLFLYGIRRSLTVIGSITEVKQRRARSIIGWVTAW